MSNLRPWLARRATLRRIGSTANLIATGAAIGVVSFLMADAVFARLASPTPVEPATAPASPLEAGAATPSSSYDNCAEARAAGDAPLFRGEPGYGPHLDADRDGIACEPYRGAP
jgi:hypothetical protein